jgi:peptidoglycan hydrolase CwlO-like protein
MKFYSIKKIFLSILFLGLIIPVFSSAEDMAETCATISESNTGCQNLSSTDCRIVLEKCAAYYEQQSVEIAKDLTKTEKEKKTLQSQVSTLKKKIQNLEYQIKQGNVMVKDLAMRIDDTEASINKTSSKIEDSQNQLINILRSIYEEDQKPSLEILLEGDLSDFFDNLVYLENLNSKVNDLLGSTKNLKSYLESQKGKMDDEREEIKGVVKIQGLQKQEADKNKKEQENYLKLTEAQYQKQLQEKQAAEKKAASIRARIFDLLGVSKAPTFGEAYEIAKYVSGITGVRTAFLLAVLTQESNIGKNVGQCYVKDFNTGEGIDLKGNPKKRVISPKSAPAFKELVSSLGMEPTETPVSCWIPLYSKGVPYGWGGAMGPAQFISSTWNLYKDEVARISGKAANPWNIKDAFLAAGLLLKDNGAKQSEFNAAMRYFSGGSWTKSESFYGNSVLSIAAQYEKDIAAIQSN